MRYKVLIAFVCMALTASASFADPVEDFYKGKQIRFIIRAAPGGNYDLYMRLLARYMVRYIPGYPEAVPVNMPGAGASPHSTTRSTSRRTTERCSRW